ncbi:MAG: hypothetical protein KDJ75_04425 [Alphaproteobacteria bacterium]|nr:hypothetical protein [Alphaproteobacteria bacterium]
MTYAPEHCEFAVTFPSEPYTSRRCDDVAREKCYDLVSYTQVYAMTSTVNFRIICNPIDKDVAKQFTPDIMKTTLKAMTRESVIKEFDTSFREATGYKQAGIVGEGQVGRTPTVYLGQLWIAEHSALSVEAELIGEPHPEADKIFSEVLKSVHFKSETEPPAEETNKPVEETDEPKAAD